MKWKDSPWYLGKKRTITTLCIIPRLVNGYWYWLEEITIEQECEQEGYDYCWKDKRVIE